MTPRRHMTDIFKEFQSDMKESLVPAEHICCLSSFSGVFHSHALLKHISISAFKRNFGRCKTCMEIESEVRNALRGRDREKLRQAKAKRLDHILLERSDKIHYYRQR